MWTWERRRGALWREIYEARMVNSVGWTWGFDIGCSEDSWVDRQRERGRESREAVGDKSRRSRCRVDAFSAWVRVRVSGL